MRGRPNRGEGEARRRAPSSALAGASNRRPERPLPPLELLLPRDWRDRAFLALDFETTGLDPARERIVEIGALRFRPGAAPSAGTGPGGELGFGQKLRELGSFASLVAPGIHIPAEVVAIHGIKDEDVASSPPFAELGPALLALAEGAVIIAHNAPFDLSFLREELARAGLPPQSGMVLDTRLLAKAAFPGLPSYKLGELARALGLDCGRAHRALDDARTCAALFLAAAPRIEALRSPAGMEPNHGSGQASEAAR